MVMTKRVLLGLSVLGVVGMHALGMTGCTTGAHHVVDAAPAASPMHLDSDHGDHDNGSGPLALCMALLVALVVTAFGGRRTTWVSLLGRPARSLRPPLPPVLRDGAPVPRFMVMRC